MMLAGCRLIFESIERITRVSRDISQKALDSNHKLKNEPDKYVYLVHPKDSGYRGIHDVYEYDVNSIAGRDRKRVTDRTSVSYILINTRGQPPSNWSDF